VEKGEWYKTFDVAAGSYSSVTETDKEKHAARRRWMSPAFTVELQRANEPAIIEVIERLCDTLDPAGDDWGKNWNITNVATHLGFDLMSRVVFGCDIRSVQEEKYRGLADSILPAMQFLYWVYHPSHVCIDSS
jgi:cytochrome P450